MKTNKIWLPKENEKVRCNTHYFLLDGFSKEKGIKFEPHSWWTKNSTVKEHQNVFLGTTCGTGKECISFEDNDAPLSLDAINHIISNQLGNNVLLIGGHYYPNPQNLSYIGEKTYDLFQYALKVLNLLQKANKEITLVFFVNDIQLDNQTRKELYANYILPEIFRKTIIQHDSIRKNIKVLIIGQKMLCNSFVKEKEEFLNKKLITSGDGTGVYWLDINGLPFRIMSTEEFPGSGHMRCVQACAKILNIAQIVQVNSVIQLYPTCGKHSIDEARIVAKKLYNYDLDTLDIYKTNSCFS
jgi:hypothetical protein